MTERPKRGSRAEAIAQLIKFNAVGLLNTAVDFVVFAILTQLGLYALIAQFVSYSAGIVNSYLWNKHWTFAERKKAADTRQAARFVALNLVSLGLSIALLYLFHDMLGLGALVSKVIVTVFTTAVNFVGSKMWVFRRRAAAESQT